MKKVNTDTIGGRIRAVRTDIGMTIVELAKAIDITSHYLSTVELGGKIPSDALLRRISEALGVSCEYLKSGAEASKGTGMPHSTATVCSRSVALSPTAVYNADSTMLLKIATEFTPMGLIAYAACTEKERNELIPCDELEKLKSMPPADLLEHLIQGNMNISAAMTEWQKVYEILQFIQQMRMLNSTLRVFMRTKFGSCEFAAPDAEGQEQFELPDGETFSVPVRTIQMKSAGFVWIFKYLYLKEIDAKQAEAILRGERCDGADRLSLVFTNEKLFLDFVDCAREYASEFDTLQAENPTRTASSTFCDVCSLLLIDKQTWSIERIKEQFLDVDSLLEYAEA